MKTNVELILKDYLIGKKISNIYIPEKNIGNLNTNPTGCIEKYNKNIIYKKYDGIIKDVIVEEYPYESTSIYLMCNISNAAPIIRVYIDFNDIELL